MGDEQQIPSELGGEFSDYYDPGALNAGGDPYGGDSGSYDDYSYPDSASTGMLPGGTDAQLTPFSPNGGFDFTDILRQAAYGAVTPRGLFGGSGSMPPALLSPPAGGYGANTPILAPPAARNGAGAASVNPGDIVRWVRQNTGLRVTAKSIVGLIVRYGFPATSALTKLGQDALLYLFMRQKGTTHHRRGPGIYTIARKQRAYASMMRTVSRVLGRGGGGHRRRRGGYHTMRRRRPRGRR